MGTAHEAKSLFGPCTSVPGLKEQQCLLGTATACPAAHWVFPCQGQECPVESTSSCHRLQKTQFSGAWEWSSLSNLFVSQALQTCGISFLGMSQGMILPVRIKILCERFPWKGGVVWGKGKRRKEDHFFLFSWKHPGEWLSRRQREHFLLSQVVCLGSALNVPTRESVLPLAFEEDPL